MKPLSRLNSGLLARKGSAAPSIDLRPEAGSLDRIIEPLPVSRADEETSVDKKANSQAFYQGVHSQPRLSILKQPALKDPSKPSIKKSAGKSADKSANRPADKSGRVAMTVRMDEDHHVKLKVYCAHTKQSAQEVFLEALDAFIDLHRDDDEMIDCACFRKSQNDRPK